MSRGRHEDRQRELARRFTHQVAVIVPAKGLGHLLSAMCTWCNDRHGPEGWAKLHRSERAPEPKDWAVFAFAMAGYAAGFRQTWTEKVTLE